MQKKYIVTGTLDHDRVLYRDGDIVLLDDDQAKLLLAIDRVKPAVEDITPAEPAQQPEQPPTQAPQGEQQPKQPASQPVVPSFPHEGIQPTPEQIHNDPQVQ